MRVYRRFRLSKRVALRSRYLTNKSVACRLIQTLPIKPISNFFYHADLIYAESPFFPGERRTHEWQQMTSTLSCERTKSNRSGWPASSKSYILCSINNSAIDLFAFHLSCGKSGDSAPRGNGCPASQRGGPNTNRDLWSRGKLPLPALLHTLPEGIGRCIG